MTSFSTIIFITAVLTLCLFLLIWYNRKRYAELLAIVEVVTVPDFPSQHLGNQRPIHIFFPAHYKQETRGYKVLYLNDGQDVAQLQLHYTLAKLFAQGRIQPIIVVAIPTNEDRLQEYGTAVCPNARGFGNKAGPYTRFLLEEVMPMVEREFRILRGREHTAVMGISLGGLSAFDIAWNHRQVFGKVGVFSGSFWWRSGMGETRFPPDTFILHEQVRRSRYCPGFRVWFEAATQDEIGDRDNNGVIDAIQDTLELIEELEKLGYERGKEVVYMEVAGGRHDYDTWARVLPDFLTWAFPGNGL